MVSIKYNLCKQHELLGALKVFFFLLISTDYEFITIPFYIYDSVVYMPKVYNGFLCNVDLSTKRHCCYIYLELF